MNQLKMARMRKSKSSVQSYAPTGTVAKQTNNATAAHHSIDAQGIVKVLHRGTLKAHKSFLKFAKYGAVGMPESYVQSVCFTELGKLLTRGKDVIMEPTLDQIRLKEAGKLDLIIGDFSDPNNPKLDIVVEFKRTYSPKTLMKDRNRILHIRKVTKRNVIGFVSFYISRKNKIDIETTRIAAENLLRPSIVSCSKTVMTVRRNKLDGEKWIKGEEVFFCNLCAQVL